MNTARGILELVKALGRIEIVPGFIVVSRDFLKIGRTILLNETRSIKTKKVHPAPFCFFFFGETETLRAAACDDEGHALIMLDEALTAMREDGYSDDWPLTLPKFIPAESEVNKVL